MKIKSSLKSLKKRDLNSKLVKRRGRVYIINKKQPLTIVKPGTQTRRFTHVLDTVNACFYAFKKNKCRHYSISHKQNLSIIQVAKMFNTKIKYLPKRRGERYASALTNMNLSNKVYKMFGKINLEDYIKNIVKLR